MNKTSQRGFTLIELLVVIAIIGILASVILASLNSARAKGTDAASKADIDNSRAQAELHYDSNSNSYAGVCTAAGTATPGGINNMVQDAANKSGFALNTSLSAAGSLTSTVCHDQASGWAASVPLKSVPNSFFCADSTGVSQVTTTALPGNAITCN